MALAVLAAIVAGCGSNPSPADDVREPSVGDRSQAPPDSAAEQSARPSHIHGLGVNPTDGALFVASHEGLFRAERGSDRLNLVGGSQRDTMGFTVLGPDQFLASGHPDAQTSDPQLLGLISSSDAGRSWRDLVLGGDADLHVIRTGDDVFYAHDVHKNRLFEGVPGGSGLLLRATPPGTVIDLAVDPRDDKRLFASTDRGLFLSEDSGNNWTREHERVGLLAFADGRLLMIDARGHVARMKMNGAHWQQIGALPDAPMALVSHDSLLVAAAADGSIVQSDNGGRTWRPRIRDSGAG